MTKSTLIRIGAFFLTVLLIVSHSTTAFEYETLLHKIRITKTFVPSSEFGTTSKTHMGYAVEQWNTAAGTTLMEISSSTHSSTGYHNTDGNNYIYKEDVGADYVAECWYIWGFFGTLTESDININSYYSWANSAQPDCYDLYSVFLHETGHAAGLADLYSPSDSAAVMYGYSATNTTKRSLTADDIAGIDFIY